ncbi:type IV pilus assembly protein PilE [Parelusimicrobium proximum]|uniref:type IV pilin protein n=1 Tax=Parelusimicrobium proximum TaxID=3228953 RepID=UPI003D173BB8
MRKGFTLIELLVVVLIIAILAAVALPQYTKAVEKARASEALLNLKAVMDAEDRYYLANDVYTNDRNALDVTVSDTNAFRYVFEMTGSGWKSVTAVRQPGSKYNIRLFKTNTDNPEYDGKKICTTSKDNEKTNAICAAITGDAGASYKHDSAMNAYFFP